MACVTKSVPKNVILCLALIPKSWKCNGCDVHELGLIAQVPYLAVNLFLRVLEDSVLGNESGWSLLDVKLEVLLRDSSRNAIVSPFMVSPLHVDILVKIHVGV
jgi:hypothetical protein